MEQLELRWLGHACFALKYKDFTVVFDPFQDNYVRGFGALDVAADLVLCSHFHNDHGAADVVRPLEGHENPFQVTGIQTFHDPEQGALRGENVIPLLEADGLRVAHFGDLGCELTPQQLEELKGLDVAMIPVGGFYTIGPEEAKALMDVIQPRVVIPMHYRMGEVGLEKVAELNDFLVQIEEYNEYPGNTITINKDTKPQVAVLKFMGN
ncbi:MAG: MBL fold metallo-hydrolase [Ruminiclostridium sp.]|nr:MBL fold metallo-hydrolase [Ruminiclostridium sp.]